MAKSSNKSENQSPTATPDPPRTEGGDGPQQQPREPQSGDPRQQIQLDDSKAIASYANFCRVMGTPEELIVDFGLNPQPMGVPTQPIMVNQRIIVNYYTAKRLLAALQMSVQRHESVFGVLETDIRKRVQPAARAVAESRG